MMMKRHAKPLPARTLGAGYINSEPDSGNKSARSVSSSFRPLGEGDSKRERTLSSNTHPWNDPLYSLSPQQLWENKCGYWQSVLGGYAPIFGIRGTLN